MKCNMIARYAGMKTTSNVALFKMAARLTRLL